MTEGNVEGGNPAIVAPVVSTFETTNTKLYVLVVTLSKENDAKLIEQLKLGFKKTIKWNKYKSQMTIQPQNNNLNYLSIDYLFYHLQEPIHLIIKTVFHTIMDQTK